MMLARRRENQRKDLLAIFSLGLLGILLLLLFYFAISFKYYD